MLKNAYKMVWVPVMGRLLTRLIPLFEGKKPHHSPTFDIDGDKSNHEMN